MPEFTPQDFVNKWKRVTSREKQTYQEHFIDLCRLVGHPTPIDYDYTSTRFVLNSLPALIDFGNHPVYQDQ